MFERFLFSKVETWIVLILVIAGLVASLLFAGAVRHYHLGGDTLGKLGPVVESLAALPANVKYIVLGRGGKTDLVAAEQRFHDQSGFSFNYAAGSRPKSGYILVNRYDGDAEHSVAELWDLNSQERVHTWSFAGVDEVWKQSTLESSVVKNWRVDAAEKRFRNAHSMLTQEGDVFSQSHKSPIVKADTCSSLSLFKDDSIYHHSIERDHGGNFWVAKHIEPKSVAIGSDNFFDDGIVLISPRGEVLFEKSVIALLDENNLGHLIYGKGLGNDDPIHLNDIEPVLADGRYWKRGDVFLSLRHQSMILHYRPSTNKVIWYKQGPWIHQHDVNVLNDYQISIFDNNARLQGERDWKVYGVNNIVVYDFDTDEARSPWQIGFEKLDIRTRTEGRGFVFDNEVIVEETNYGRLIQFSSNGSVSWQFINRAKDGIIYLLSWSRPISRELGDLVRASLYQRSCP